MWARMCPSSGASCLADAALSPGPEEKALCQPAWCWAQQVLREVTEPGMACRVPGGEWMAQKGSQHLSLHEPSPRYKLCESQGSAACSLPRPQGLRPCDM